MRSERPGDFDATVAAGDEAHRDVVATDPVAAVPGGPIQPNRSPARPWMILAALAVLVGTAVGLTVSSHAARGAATGDLGPGTSAGRGLVALVVHPPTEPIRIWRVLRADTTPSIEHGLMNVTDPSLGGHHGMLFLFARPVTVGFWMKDTPLPLTIAFFSADGVMQDPTIDMAPCGDSGNCPQYTARQPYRYALEVPQHQLRVLGLVPGSRITVPDP